MVPIKQIRKGIEKGDWSLVVKGYIALTGEDIEIPIGKTLESSPITLSEIIEALQNLDNGKSPEVSEKPDKPEKKTRRKKVKNNFEVIADDDKEYGKPSAIGVGSDVIREKQVKAITLDQEDAKTQKINNKIKTARIPRDAYKPDLIECIGCKKEYDGNKYGTIIMGGNRETGTHKYKCPYCKEVIIE